MRIATLARAPTAIAGLLLISATLGAQQGVTHIGTGSCEVSGGPGSAASSAVYRLTPACLLELRKALNAARFGEALHIYFGSSYNPVLANWVVYVRADGTVQQAVIQRGKVTELLRAEKYVYAAAFFEALPTNPLDTETPGLELSRRSINFTKDQITGVLVNAFGAGKIPAFDKGATVADLDRAMNLRLVSDDPATPLWAGSARVEIGENTDVQLSLSAKDKQRLPGTLSRLYTTVNNAKASRWDLGIGFATAFGLGAKHTTATTEVDEPAVKSNIYLTTYLNFLPARLPRFRRSWGLVGGTNITKGSLLDELLTGVAVGRVLGDAGIMTGIMWEQRKREVLDIGSGVRKTTQSRVPRFFIGIDLRA